jgi:hypothetical protein
MTTTRALFRLPGARKLPAAASADALSLPRAD